MAVIVSCIALFEEVVYNLRLPSEVKIVYYSLQIHSEDKSDEYELQDHILRTLRQESHLGIVT